MSATRQTSMTVLFLLSALLVDVGRSPAAEDRPVSSDRTAAGRAPAGDAASGAYRVLMFDILMVSVDFGASGEIQLKTAERRSPADSPKKISVGQLPSVAEVYFGQAGGAEGREFGNALNPFLQTLSEANVLRAFTYLRVAAIDGEEVTAQIGSRNPRVFGTTTRPGGTINQVQMESVGTLIKLRPLIHTDGRIVATLSVESSGPGPEDEGTIIATSPEGKPIRATVIDTRSLTTSAAALPGQVIVASHDVQKRESKVVEHLVLLRARLATGR